MNNSKKSEVKVGITVVIGLLLFVWILSWAKNVAFFSDDKDLRISFSNVPGLELGDVVTINGVRNGNVKTIELKETEVLVTISVEGSLKLFEDATFNLMMLDLMGGKKIEIYPGNSNVEMDYVKIQKGIFTGDIATTMVMLNSVQTDLVDVIKDVRISLREMNKLFDEGNLKEEIYLSLKSAREATDNLTLILKENRENIYELINKGNELSQNANDLITENKENVSSLLDEIKNVVNNSEIMIKNLNSMIQETKDQKNNFGKILYDEELLNSLKNTISQLQELTSIVKKQIEGKGFKVDANIF